MTGERGLDEPETQQEDLDAHAEPGEPIVDAVIADPPAGAEAEDAADAQASKQAEAEASDEPERTVDVDDAELLDDFELADDVEVPLDDDTNDADAGEADEPEPEPELAESAEDESTEPGDSGEQAEGEVEPWQPPRRRFRWFARIIGVIALGIPTAAVVMLAVRAVDESDQVAPDARLADALRYDGAGNPLVLAPDGTTAQVGVVRRQRWRICEGTECGKLASRAAKFQPGLTPAGKTIAVVLVGTKRTTTITTPEWLGQLRATAPPTLVGDVKVGGTVQAKAGTWTGGWDGGTSLVGLRACPTAESGPRCVAFTASALASGHDKQRVIPEDFRGWWVGAVEWQVAPLRTANAITLGDPLTPESAQTAPLPSAAVAASKLVGPIR